MKLVTLKKRKTINFLKELVTEPSNIIYPTSFTKKTLTQINKKNVKVSSLSKKQITKISFYKNIATLIYQIKG